MKMTILRNIICAGLFLSALNINPGHAMDGFQSCIDHYKNEAQDCTVSCDKNRDYKSDPEKKSQCKAFCKDTFEVKGPEECKKRFNRS